MAITKPSHVSTGLHHLTNRANYKCDDARMRITLDIDDDVMKAVRQLARTKKQGLGRTMSDVARRGLTPSGIPERELQFRIPVWKHGPGAVAVTSELVRNLADRD